jgi:hypothetical protein
MRTTVMCLRTLKQGLQMKWSLFLLGRQPISTKSGRSSYIKNRSMGAACTDLQRQTNLLKHRDNTVGEKWYEEHW